ncbi:MAG: DUF3329 domain-containing protein [Mariniblastus sp.]|nr:DUF3329 domain-containing protein [Mariniblastus sp.]
MEPLDIVIYTVVLTAVVLAAAQTAFLNLSDKAEEVPLINKIIGMLGLAAAGFTLFASPIVLGEVKGVILILLVLAIVAVAALAGKIKKSRQPQPEKEPIPERAISSHEPDPKVAWCGHCRAHTIAGQTTATHHNEHGAVTSSYPVACCGHCQARMLWNVPSDIRQAKNWTLGCATVVGLITAASFILGALWNNVFGLLTGTFAAALFVVVLGFLIWFLFLRWQWRKWLSQQPRPFSIDRTREPV